MSSPKRPRLSQVEKPPKEATAWCYTGNAEDVNFSFAWTINHFDRKMASFKKDECLTSDVFKIVVEGVETAWRLHCYPNGHLLGPDDAGNNISLFIRPINPAALFKKFSMVVELVDNEGNSVQKIREANYCFTGWSSWGYPKFVSHQTLISRGMLPRNCLNIFCTLKFQGQEVTTSGTSTPSSTFLSEKPEDCSCLTQVDLLATGDLADVEVVCQGKTFHCHKAILGSKSPVFRAAFMNDMKEKTMGKYIIKGIRPNTVTDMLTYIYGGKIDDEKVDAEDLLAAADRYDLKQLKKRCEQLLAKSLNITNCLDYLVLVDLHSSEQLKSLVLGFVVENSREVMAQDNWEEKLTGFPNLLAEVLKEMASCHPPKK